MSSIILPGLHSTGCFIMMEQRAIVKHLCFFLASWAITLPGFVVGQKPHVTCERTFNKIGCFQVNSIVTNLLVDDYAGETSDKSQGHTIAWEEMDKYLHSLACRCAEEAKKYQYQYFGIRNFGSCFGGNVGVIDGSMKSPDCFQGISYGPCDDTNIEECGGKPSTDYVYALKTFGADVDGGYSEWSAWSGCSAECGGGIMSRTRACINPKPQGQGKDCRTLGNDTDLSECGTTPCPVDGGFTEWSLFGSCSKTCGGGVMKRTRSCTNPAPANGGDDCTGPKEEIQICNMEACPVHGGFSDWSKFSPCSVTCGKGIHHRERSCTNPPPSNGGDDCKGDYKETAECEAGGCPVDGGYSDWEATGNCSKECGGGEQLYTRLCDNPRPEHGGVNCSSIGPDREMRECNIQPCPIDGGLSQWTNFGNCSSPCGVGFRFRTRKCNNPVPQHGGKDCEGELLETEDCRVEHCDGNLAYLKSTNQSSTGFGGISSRATDGHRYSNYYASSCTHTNRDQNPWWRVDLGARHVIGNVKLTNRGDCCSSRLRNVEVRVGDVDAPNNNHLCTYFAGMFGAGEHKTLSCPVPVIGRYVYISLRAQEWLTLCEVEVYSPDPANLARGKPTKQTSTTSHGRSILAVDGNAATNYPSGTCTHTDKHKNPWWRVDLGNVEPIGKVVVTNRGDCCSERLRNVEIRVGDIDNRLAGNEICAYQPGALAAGQRKAFYCQTIVRGRFVFVTIKADDYLTLCEVEVYKGNLDNLARGKPTRQSSTSYSGNSSRAVDGNTDAWYWDQSCTHTGRELGAWWRVDLGNEESVGKIGILNRADCCAERLQNFEIRVGNTDSPIANTICHYRGQAPNPGEMANLYCSRPIQGRYVFVRLRGTDYLTLCEVEVYTLKDGEKVDGGFSEWSTFSECSVSCGGGKQLSTRTCSNPYPANGGAACTGLTSQEAPCNTHKCPVDGGLSLWSSWGQCLARCGTGKQHRRRQCNSPPPQHGGKPCEGLLVESRTCTSQPCPVDGGYGPWTIYHTCSVTCGVGQQIRTRKCNSPTPAHGGRDCARLGPSAESRRCRRTRCPRPVSPLFYRRVCQHGAIDIVCPIGSHIRIHNAMYGRKSQAYCRRGWFWDGFENIRCVARRSRALVSHLCNNNRVCNVPAKNWLFGNPCRGTHKYLEVRYRCFGRSAQSFHATMCQGERRTISCSFGRKIKIIYAMYGRQRKIPKCGGSTAGKCMAASSLTATKFKCDGKTSCSLVASKAVYGDPCVSVSKYLDVRYKCVW